MTHQSHYRGEFDEEGGASRRHLFFVEFQKHESICDVENTSLASGGVAL